jgi:NADH-quinone oxidoreductase subunit M
MGFVVLGLAIATLMYGTSWAKAHSQTNLLAGVAGVYDSKLSASEIEQRLATDYPPERMEEDMQDARTALDGSVLQMFNHGLTSAGMFLLAGSLYHKAHTRDLRRFGGLWDIMPMFGGLLIFVSMASLGLPGLNGFVGEFLIISGSFKLYPIYVLLSMFGLLVTGIYILKAIQMLLHGPQNEEWVEYDRTQHKLEITRREVVALAPLAVLMLITGLYPNWVLQAINHGVLRFLGG